LYNSEINELINENYYSDDIVTNKVQLKESNNWYIQEIDTIQQFYRAFVNSYYWLMNPNYNINNRNLGFNNMLQNKLINIYRSKVNDFIQENYDFMIDKFGKEKLDDFISKSLNIDDNNYWKLFYFVLSKIYDVVIYIYNNKKILLIIHPQDGYVENKIVNEYNLHIKKIYIQIQNITTDETAETVESLYPK
jgi:hypothetical protein